MDRNAILDAMEKKAKAIYESNPKYVRYGKRGMLVVETKDPDISGQWDSTSRSFGTVFRDYSFDGELVVNNGTNFDALAHGKVAFSRRKNLNSGTNYYQVLGYESFFKGSVISDDGKCICAFAGLSQSDDEIIATAGIECYESQKESDPNFSSASADEQAQPGESAVNVPKKGAAKKQ